jgi:hypothetical protein
MKTDGGCKKQARWGALAGRSVRLAVLSPAHNRYSEHMNELQPQPTGEPATGRVYWRVAEMAHKRGLVSRTGRTPGRPSSLSNHPFPSHAPSLDPDRPPPFDLPAAALTVLDTPEPQPAVRRSG